METINTSCLNCKFLHRLDVDNRIHPFNYVCIFAGVRAAFLSGAGRVAKPKDIETDYTSEEEEKDTRLYMTHPNDATCENFIPLEASFE